MRSILQELSLGQVRFSQASQKSVQCAHDLANFEWHMTQINRRKILAGPFGKLCFQAV